jgi:small subunit ribosomal protein S8
MDPISDMFTRLRNALKEKKDSVSFDFSNSKFSIAKILYNSGFINSYTKKDVGKNKFSIDIVLKYLNGKSAITEIKRKSRSSKRIYVKKSCIPKVLGGFGESIISTSKGLMSGKEARILNLGGEIVGEVY